MAANINANTLTQLQIVKYSRKLLEFMVPQLLLAQFAQKPEMLGEGEGSTCIFSRFIPISTGTAITAVTHDSGASTASKKTAIQQITVTPALYADSETFDLFDNRTAFLNYIKGASKEYGTWYAKQLNYALTKVVSVGALHVRADWDTTYQATGVADASSTTILTLDAEEASTTSLWVGGYITYLTGQNKGMTRKVSASTQSTSIAHAAFPHAPVAGDRYFVCVGTGLTAGDSVTKEVVKKAVAYLEQLDAPKVGSHYIGYIDSRGKYDFLEDMVSVAQYTTLGIEKVFKNEIGEAYGVRWVRAWELYREDANSTENRTTGAVHNILILGSDSFGEMDVAAGPNKPEINVALPGPQTTADVNKLQGALGIKCAHAPIMLNACSCISILSVPSDTVNLLG